MKKYQKEITSLTAKEVLFSIFDCAIPFFEAHSMYRISAKKYKEERNIERSNFLNKINYLKRHGFIKSFIEGKEKYLEITPKGLERILKIKAEEIPQRPEKWDNKWRIIIFDVPNKQAKNRDMFRRKLINLQFEKVQESVYVYPFECTDQITLLSNNCSIANNVLIMVAEIIQGEDAIIEHFLGKKILNKNDLS